MKKTFKLLLLSTILFTISCSKSKDKLVLDEKLTGGRWKLSESLNDPGSGTAKWAPVSANPVYYVSFKDNGQMEGNMYPDYTSYTLKDSVTLSFIKKDKSIQNYRYKIDKGVLSMSPAGPIMCIEACGTRYVKIE